MPSGSDGRKVGWDFVAWTGAPAKCNVPSCGKEINAGQVRVDRPRPQDGDPVLCVDCHGMIQMGIDPDPAAHVPDWEQENREQRLKEMIDAQEG